MTPEQKRFATNARKVMRDVAAYVADPVGDYKIELKFFKRRDALHDLRRKLGLLDDPASSTLEEEVRAVVSKMHDAAAATRRAHNDAEIKRLKGEYREEQAKLTGYEKELRLMRNRRQ